VDLGFFSSGRNLAASIAFCEGISMVASPRLLFARVLDAVVVQGQKGSADAIFNYLKGLSKLIAVVKLLVEKAAIDDVVDHVLILDDVWIRNASRGRFASIGNHTMAASAFAV